MSFHKREITDYIKDIPMRFSNSYAQLQPENNLNIDLNPIYVECLTSDQFNYDFNAERTALLDAERERERVLKEAEEKLKELELNNKFNETQVKKPIEDVINSSKPIQLTNLPSTTNYGYQNSNSNLTYITTSNPAVYNSFNYNNSTIQHPTPNLTSTNNFIQTPTNLSQTTASLQQSSLTNSLPQVNLTQASNLSQPSSLTQQSANLIQQNSLPTNLHLNNQQTNLHNLPTGLANYFPIQSQQTNLSNNLTRNLSINLPPNNLNHDHDHQLTKNNSDNNLQQNLQLNNFQQNNTYFQQQFSHQLNSIPQPTNLTNNYIYSSSPTNYSTNSIRVAYDTLNSHVYPTISQNNHIQTSINHLNLNSQTVQQQTNKTNYNIATNFVPSTITKYTNGILLPQQQLSNSQEVDKINSAASTSNTQLNNKTENSTKTQLNDSSINLRNLIVNGKKINVADFENSSSPFDDALLKSIDDKEELNNVFQQFYNGGRK